jgi:hypothetical protein
MFGYSIADDHTPDGWHPLETYASATLYPFDDTEMKGSLSNRSWKTGAEGAIPSCQIPFYHLPIKNQDDSHRMWRTKNAERSCINREGALIISSAVIITLKSMTLLLHQWLPSSTITNGISILISIIADYLPPLHLWKDEVGLPPSSHGFYP